MAVDKAKWHYEAENYPDELDEDCAATHIGMFLAWAVLHGLVGDELREDSNEAIDALCSRRITGREFLIDECDGCLGEGDLNDEGKGFAASYYTSEAPTEERYLLDYSECLAENVESIYHVEDSWENYDRLAPVIDRAFADWRHRTRA